MSPRMFDRIMIDLELATNAKIGRFSDSEFRCLVTGVWPLAAKARVRGCLLVGELPAEPADVARQAHCTVAVARRTLVKMRDLGMLEPDADLGCECIHDWHEFQVEPRSTDPNGARRQALHRDPDLRAAIRLRDQGRCRYCGVDVHWTDRRSAVGGTYDHIDPDGPNAEWNLVVACRGCNSRKRNQPLDVSGMELLPVPDTNQNGSSSIQNGSTPEEKRREKTPLTPQGEDTEGTVVTFDRRPVPPTRLALAERLLDEFNRQAGTSYGAFTGRGRPSEDLRRIIGALTDATPPLDFDEAQRMIAARLANPFWEGRPHTGVVFGPKVFTANRESATGPNGTTRSTETAALAAALRRDRGDAA